MITRTDPVIFKKEHPNVGCSFFLCAFARRALTPSGSYPHACWGCSQNRDLNCRVSDDVFATQQPASRASYTFSFSYCSIYLIMIFLPLLI